MKKKKTTTRETKAFAEQELKQLGKRIRQLRMERGYTSYEYFAYEHDFSRAQFGRYEKGEDLRFSSLVKIAKAFGMSLPEFFSQGFDTEPNEAK